MTGFYARKTLGFAPALFLLLFLIATASAQTPGESAREHTIRTLIQKVVQTAAPDAKISIGSLQAIPDMTPCDTQPDVELYGRGRYRDARVSCPTQGWQLYIPVRIAESNKIVVAAHDLQAGTVLHSRDLKLVSTSSTEASAPAAHDASAVVGHTLVAPISAGTPISLSGLQQAVRVHSGETITVHVRSGGVRIKTNAVALQDGRPGQSILVENPATSYRYRVEVTDHGAVENLTW